MWGQKAVNIKIYRKRQTFKLADGHNYELYTQEIILLKQYQNIKYTKSETIH